MDKIQIIALIGGIVTIASIIVKLTPTQVDNKIMNFILKILKVFSLYKDPKNKECIIKNIIDFKTPRIFEEWHDGTLDIRLKNYVTLIALYTWTEFEKRIVLTSIYRSKEEDQKIGGSGIHACWRAVDIRTSNLIQTEIRKIVEICNNYLHYDNGKFRHVAIYGDKRHRDHIHLQIGWR